MSDTTRQTDEPRHGWILSLAFWLCLLLAGGLYAAVALSPKILAHLHLKQKFYENQIRLVTLERQVQYLGKVVVALENEPDFAAELLRVDFDASRPGDERIAVDRSLSLGAPTADASTKTWTKSPADTADASKKETGGDRQSDDADRLPAKLSPLASIAESNRSTADDDRFPNDSSPEVLHASLATAAMPWYGSLLQPFAHSATLRLMLLIAAALLTVLAFAFLHEPQTPQPSHPPVKIRRRIRRLCDRYRKPMDDW
jgi:hypothetical protein